MIAQKGHMNRRSIPPREWPAFLKRFGLRHRSWLATVEEWPRSSPEITRVSDRPLLSLDAEHAGHEVRAVVIRFCDTPDGLRIVGPQALRVDETPRGEEVGLDLETDTGVTRLRFRAAALPEELDGVAPSEL